ncbi:hypothetical protein DFR58_11747 [Anaerobacterium chartisolvens]|uniref:Uncharacterized protein n=1 Tax=Anaerobacterium chartisolvens TaxID=1297424 RepID=A0A369AZ91_9FIRM|nr:hypothetical protein DFR58_11747 [Anaerobacterium chartisolvens]
MENKEELLKAASRLAELGTRIIVEKFVSIYRHILDRNGVNPNSPVREGNVEERLNLDIRKEFIETVSLYCRKPEILGGGETNKQSFKRFAAEGLGIMCRGDGAASWNKKELAELGFRELSFVLGWAGRLAKTGDKKPKNGTFEHKEGFGDFKGKKTEDVNTKKETLQPANLDDSLAMLAKSINKNRM